MSPSYFRWGSTSGYTLSRILSVNGAARGSLNESDINETRGVRPISFEYR